MYNALLSEHRELLTEHRKLLETLRSTPYFAASSDQPLYMTEDEEDARHHNGTAPPVHNPFTDFREDEAMLANAFGLAGNINTH